MGYRALTPAYGLLPPKVKVAPKVADPFYLSAEWRRLVARLKRERGAACERCGSGHRLIGDHVVERRDGGAELDPANVELLCQACHNAKTAKARAARAGRGG
ncbi:MAG: HNH endonuclease [Planctomycetes bacterium ADurb.Bin069]|nr:MAG: HNH endonuclease [Planctomycetes bacterium ADurb.Bin069]